MADIESKFRIRAQASGFKGLEEAANRLAQAFRRVGQAGLEMGKNTQQGVREVAKTLKDAGAGPVGGPGGSPASGGGTGRRNRTAGGGAGADTIQTGDAAALRVGHGGGGSGGVPSPPSGSGGGGGGTGGGRGQGVAATVDRRAGSFTQGLLQGALPESFIERGPGAYQQAAGVLTGRLARRTAGAAVDFGMASTRGPDAIAGSLAGVPLVGGLLSSTLGAGIQAARQEASAQTGFSGLMPYINQRDGGFGSRMNAERSRLGALGLQFAGMSENQSLGAFGSAAAQAGGLTRNYSDARLGRALQAQQGFGVDLGTSMRLLRGEDLGQAVGGRAGNNLGAALGNAQSLGLEGSEITQYVRRMAANLEEVNRTGIRFSAEGQGDLERALGRGLVGVAGSRTAELGQNLNAGISQLTQSGPQNASQALLLQSAGYSPENPESYGQALRNLEDPTKRAGYVAQATRTMRRSTRGMSKNQQAEVYRQFMAQMQVNLSNTEAYDAVRTGALDAGLASTSGGGAPMADQALQQMALSNTPVSMRREAAMANTDTRVGMQQLPAVQTADENAKRFTTSVQGVGNTFLNAANSIADVGRQLVNFGMSAAGASGATTAFR